MEISTGKLEIEWDMNVRFMKHYIILQDNKKDNKNVFDSEIKIQNINK